MRFVTESREIKDLNDVKESNFSRISQQYFIHKDLANLTEAGRLCDQRHMKLVRIMTMAKYAGVVNYVRLWLYQMYLQNETRSLKWHRIRVWTAMVLAADKSETQENVRITSVW